MSIGKEFLIPVIRVQMQGRPLPEGMSPGITGFYVRKRAFEASKGEPPKKCCEHFDIGEAE